MTNPLKLTSGQEYVVVKEFIDFDGIVHPVGESWIFETTNFLPQEFGLTLHVLSSGKKEIYRLQWTADQQSSIIENFLSYVQLGQRD